MPSRALHRFILPALVVLATRSEAQDIPAATGPDPRFWISASAGPVKYPQLNFLNNTSRDNVDAAMSIRGTVEIDIGQIGGLGVTVASANFPINYVTTRQDDPCVPGCEAKIRATSILATLRIGGGLGFEQLFEANAGFTLWGDLESTQPLLDARAARNDFTAGVGYGASYGFTPQLSAMLIADLGLVFHDNPNDDVDIQGSYYSHFIGLRAGLRYGLWNR